MSWTRSGSQSCLRVLLPVGGVLGTSQPLQSPLSLGTKPGSRPMRPKRMRPMRRSAEEKKMGRRRPRSTAWASRWASACWWGSWWARCSPTPSARRATLQQNPGIGEGKGQSQVYKWLRMSAFLILFFRVDHFNPEFG